MKNGKKKITIEPDHPDKYSIDIISLNVQLIYKGEMERTGM